MKALLLALTAAATLTAAAEKKDDCAGPHAAKTPATSAGAATEGFACKLGVFTSGERKRHTELSAKLMAAATQVTETEVGYALRVDPAKATVMELAEWIDGERRCCPFFDLQLQLEPHGKAVWVRLGGAEGVKAFIRDEIEMALAQK